MPAPTLTLVETSATRPVADALKAFAAPDGRGLVVDAHHVDAAEAALRAGRPVLMCGRPASLDGLIATARSSEGVLLVADPPSMLVIGDQTHAAVVEDITDAAWLFLAAVIAHDRPDADAIRAVLDRPAQRFAGGGWVHDTVQIDGDVTLGAGTRVWHFSKLLGPLTIGDDCTLGQNVVVERRVTIGRNVKIQNNVSVYSGVVLEDDVFCGPSMVFTNVGTPRSHYPRKGAYLTTRVGRGASIGANATVVCGVTLGPYSFVGAGAVVTRDVPAHGLVYGNPARLRGWACYCGDRLPLGAGADGEAQAGCGTCGRRYVRSGADVRLKEETG